MRNNNQRERVLNFLQEGKELSVKNCGQIYVHYLSSVIRDLRAKGYKIDDYKKNNLTHYYMPDIRLGKGA